MSAVDTEPGELTAAEELAIIQAVTAAKNPRLARPTIAGNHHQTLADLDELIIGFGWPDIPLMRRNLARAHTSPDPAPHHTPGPPAPKTTPGENPAPFIAALPIDKLFADPTYQRDLDILRVQRMASTFDIALVGIIEVSRRTDGRHAILDGQHRWATIRDCSFDTEDENPHVVCRIHQGLTVTEEAALYHQLNTTRKQLTGWDRWIARRAAGEPLVLDIEATAKRHDFTIGMRAAPAVLRATKACENVVDLDGINLLDRVLATIRATYRDDQAGLDAAIIHGLGHILHAYTHTELDDARLIGALSGILPRQITARASAVREIHKGTLDRLTAHVIVERYNSTPGPKLEAFFARVKPLSKAKGAEARKNLAIREWAARRDINLTPTRIARQVREAYDEAHRTNPTLDPS